MNSKFKGVSLILIAVTLLAATPQEIAREKQKAQSWGIDVGMDRDQMLSLAQAPQKIGSPEIVYRNDNNDNRSILIYRFEWTTENLKHQKSVEVDGNTHKVINQVSASLPK